MSATSIPDIAEWIDDVNTPRPEFALGEQQPGTFSLSRPPTLPVDTCLVDDKED